MPGAKSNSFKENLIDYVLGGVSFTPPASYWLALFTANDGPETGEDEVDGSGYVRMEIENTTDSWDGSNGSRSNVEVIEFPEATGDWGTVRAWALMDSSTGGDETDVFYYGTFDTAKTVQANDTVRIPVSVLTITEE